MQATLHLEEEWVKQVVKEALCSAGPQVVLQAQQRVDSLGLRHKLEDPELPLQEGSLEDQDLLEDCLGLNLQVEVPEDCLVRPPRLLAASLEELGLPQEEEGCSALLVQLEV